MVRAGEVVGIRWWVERSAVEPAGAVNPQPGALSAAATGRDGYVDGAAYRLAQPPQSGRRVVAEDGMVTTEQVRRRAIGRAR
jgi:hypothetical protein